MNHKFLVTIILLLAFNMCVTAQINPKKFSPFIRGMKILSSSGPGLNNSSGDILLELGTDDDPDFETLLLLRNTKGKLSVIAKNRSLVMGHEMLGNAGWSNSSLNGNTLSVFYSIGSKSGQSDVSIEFEKNNTGEYVFTKYTTTTQNYGVENLSARQKITAAQTGKLNFVEATEDLILKRSKVKITPEDTSLMKAQSLYAKYIPGDYRLAAYATGDLNTDGYKRDLILVFYNDEDCVIKLFLEQKDGSYQEAKKNSTLIAPDENFNIHNLKLVIKNGFFTIEQKVAIGDKDYDHRYYTFKYNAPSNKWLFHRYDVEHYSGFNQAADKNVIHLSVNDFGTWDFEKLDFAPGDYFYDPEWTEITGTIIKKTFPDSREAVFVLKTDYPVNALALPVRKDEIEERQTDIPTIRGERELQVFSSKDVNLDSFLNRKVLVDGKISRGQPREQFTTLVMEILEIKLHP